MSFAVFERTGKKYNKVSVEYSMPEPARHFKRLLAEGRPSEDPPLVIRQKVKGEHDRSAKWRDFR